MTTPGRLGQHAGEAAASFRCAACGEMAAVVKAVPAGRTADMGPPLGPQLQSGDGVVVDYFGGTAWKRLEAPAYQAVREILSGQAPDPTALRRINWELAPFTARTARRTTAAPAGAPYMLFDEGSCDCTMGRCPRGHEHMVDD